MKKIRTITKANGGTIIEMEGDPVPDFDTKSSAIITLKDAPEMSEKGRNEIADWLVRQAEFFRNNAAELSGRFTARYLYTILAAFLWIAPLAALPLLTGCASLNDGLSSSNAQRIQTSVKLAAYLGTSAYLKDKPQARPAFVIARDKLVALSTAENIDAVSLLAIVNELPIKELNGEQSKIIITAATIILSDFAGQLQLDQLKQLQPIAAAMAEGITLGLGTP